ncbi:MAG: hypothetical protein JXK93_12085 [Sphaerochaetaceae bacterium]|nr:hypothetical protein [Sphaerochaetaceae bacterium]
MDLTDEDINRIATAIATTPGIAVRAKKPKRKNFEKRMVYEYTTSAYPNELQWKNVRVGPIKPSKFGNMYAFLRRWADAIVVTKKEVVIIEGKIKPAAGVISQLQLYIEEFPRTPEFNMVKHMPVRGEIVSVFADEIVDRMAHDAGLRTVIYEPSFMQEILESL